MSESVTEHGAVMVPTGGLDALRREGDEFLRMHPEVGQLISSMGCEAVLLNGARRVVFLNELAAKISRDGDIERLRGGYLGDVFGCMKQKQLPGSCGEREVCQYCGGNRVVQKAMRKHESVSGTCRVLQSVEDGGTLDADMTVAPVYLGTEEYFLVTLRNVSDDTQRRLLERLFFHDVLNSASTINGMIHLLRDATGEELPEYVELLQQVNDKLVSTVKQQRQLAAAETGALVVRPELVNVTKMLREVAEGLRANPVAARRTIEQAACPDIDILTDVSLLERILVNMVKNALEATDAGGVVRVGATLDEAEQNVTFWVQNASAMAPEVKHQVFQRSFSTKGLGRGMGTHSIRLFGERYLRGKVSFVSDSVQGTRFSLRLPLQWTASAKGISKA